MTRSTRKELSPVRSVPTAMSHVSVVTTVARIAAAAISGRSDAVASLRGKLT
ncbi:hypothetical protein [Nonomuraea basaltis]|uniref:hypothetical protein n=1 Tax=Nonomuraea basaltis TaxID=2495887 RepID=UPI001486CECF|nr:hypothetical protein [Nonomuraea basaltis]